MNKIFIIVILISNLSFAQNQRYRYLYQFVPDSTNRSEIKSEMMILYVLPKFSKFYSETVFKSDSIANVILEKELLATGSINIKPDMRKSLFRNTIIKEYPDFKTLLITKFGQSQLKVEDKRKINWKISPEKEKIGNFLTQKAETKMYGRKWFAWFTPEIPIQDGPYKFHGLPGLILKIEDETKSHSFSLSEIKNLSAETIKEISPDKNFIFDSGQYITMDFGAYKKLFLENRNDANKSLRLALGQTENILINTEGKTNDIELLRNREKQQRESNAKDNNILELDLLK